MPAMPPGGGSYDTLENWLIGREQAKSKRKDEHEHGERRKAGEDLGPCRLGGLMDTIVFSSLIQKQPCGRPGSDSLPAKRCVSLTPSDTLQSACGSRIRPLDTGVAKAVQLIGPHARTPDGDMEKDAC